MPPTKTKSTDYKPEDQLQQLPGNWHYGVASPEEQALFQKIIGELLAEEVSSSGRGALATVIINQIIESTAGHLTKTWIPKVRQILKQVPAAEAIVAKTSAAKLESAEAKSKVDLAKAIAFLEQAEQSVIAVEVKLKMAANDLYKFREASKMLSDPTPGQAIAAIEHLRRLRDNG